MQGRKKNFSGPKKFYFLSPEAGQQARKEKTLFRPQKVLFSIARGRSAGKEGKKNCSGPKKFYFLSPEAGQQARKEKKLFRPQKVLFSIARGRSAGKEGIKTFQAQKSFIFYRQRPVSRQGRKKIFQAPKSFIFYRQRPVSRQGRKKHFSGPKKFYFLSPEAGQQARKEKKLFRPQKVLFSIARGPLRGLTAAEAVGFRVFPEEHCISAIMSEMSPPKRKKRKDRSDSDLKIPARHRGSWKKKFFGSWKVFSLGLDPGKKAHKLLSSFELTR